MTREQVRAKVAGMLLSELVAGNMGWYYVSVAAGMDFYGGWVVQARGPTEAWCLLHSLGAIPKGAETLTSGPIAEDIMARIPASLRWRRLDRVQSESLGKE